jgi:hypothetical protein
VQISTHLRRYIVLSLGAALSIQSHVAAHEIAFGARPIHLQVADDKLAFHDIKVDASGGIVPWCSGDSAHCYDHVIMLTKDFWLNMNTEDTVDKNGNPVKLPYYMLHQVWTPDGDFRGIGGDQLQMAMSAWGKLYAYSGDERLKDNMRFMADYYLKNSFSAPDDKWPGLPYPYNTPPKRGDAVTGKFDGDMVNGKDVLQPDKAGSFALELVHLYKITSADSQNAQNSKDPSGFAPSDYLSAAIKIAQTLMSHMTPGDDKNSPLPFRVNTKTGEIPDYLVDKFAEHPVSTGQKALYTTDWFATMQLFLDLQKLDPSHSADYKKSYDVFVTWLKNYPLKTNKWGPFFEDVSGYSDTQINATTAARFIMEHPKDFPDWKEQAQSIFAWVHDPAAGLGDTSYAKYKVLMPDEQTSYRVPGESHTARQGATELEYAVRTGKGCQGDDNAIRELNWSTYWVDNNGRNNFPSGETWLTDGYGDYDRHYLAAMASCPGLAPNDASHILSSSSVIQKVSYDTSANASTMSYRTFDKEGTETIRMAAKPTQVLVGGESVSQKSFLSWNYYQWTTLPEGGGVLEITRSGNDEVTVVSSSRAPALAH